MSFEENKQFWEEFIEMYRAHPCLWEVKSKAYTNRTLKKRAYLSLIEKCKAIKPGADKNYVIKKISSLRASFRRQFRKIQEARASTGPTSDEVPEATLWYFDLLTFTLDTERWRHGTASCNAQEMLEEDPGDRRETENESESTVYSQMGTSYEPLPPFMTARNGPAVSPSRMKRQRAKQNSHWFKNRMEMSDDASRYLQDNVPENVNSVFGKSVGLELDVVADCEQNDIAKKLISDVLFLAKRGKLTCESYVQVEPRKPAGHSFEAPA